MGEKEERLAAGKIYRDGHPDRHRFAVDDRRVVPPLTHGFQRCLVEGRNRLQHAGIGDDARIVDEKFGNHNAVNTRGECVGGVGRVAKPSRRRNPSAHALNTVRIRGSCRGLLTFILLHDAGMHGAGAP